MSIIRIFLFFVLSVMIYAQESKYELGKGLQIGSLPLYIGGYVSLEYEYFDNTKSSFALDDVAILAYGNYENASYMLELEAKDMYAYSKGDSKEINSNHFHIERLYVGYEFGEKLAIKLGKYNSPIGFWNLMPINILRDTSSSPKITKLLFPNFTSGLELEYHLGNEGNSLLHLMMQESEDIDKWINDEVYNTFELDRHYGLGLSLEHSDINYQLNAGYFHTIHDESYYYLLAGFEYKKSDFKLLGELGSQFDEDAVSMPYIAYLQYSQIIKDNHELILRGESYENKKIDIKDTFLVAGYTYRPLAPLALKFEYQWHSYKEEEKALFSFSILF
ncbi:hypothetical protein MNB_SV-13-1607 [hydrothermal vent metagenome]|uniref:Porin domain-containing protein n=1 Tax=hydrothermal vent metagenome TaxID=652676 RepID=A0A1W1C7L9_9ZZZZ